AGDGLDPRPADDAIIRGHQIGPAHQRGGDRFCRAVGDIEGGKAQLREQRLDLEGDDHFIFDDEDVALFGTHIVGDSTQLSLWLHKYAQRVSQELRLSANSDLSKSSLLLGGQPRWRPGGRSRLRSTPPTSWRACFTSG